MLTLHEYIIQKKILESMKYVPFIYGKIYIEGKRGDYMRGTVQKYNWLERSLKK